MRNISHAKREFKVRWVIRLGAENMEQRPCGLSALQLEIPIHTKLMR